MVILKPLREGLHLEPGDTLELDRGGQQITLRPLRGTGPLTKEHDVWAFHAEQSLSAETTDELLERIREERDLGNLSGDQ